MTRRILAGILAVVSLGILCMHEPLAGSYPERLIRIIVPLGAGGPNDVAARLIGQKLQARLDQGVIVENRPGAGGATGTRYVATADADGYTLLAASSATLAVIPAVVHDPGYDPIRSFAPVAHISDSTTFLATRRGLAARSVSELIAYARAHPGQLNYASAGTGNQTHLVGELFRTRTATDIVHVPYKSGGEMLSALLAEQVDLAFIDVSILLPLLHEGRLNALAALSTARHPLLPDVPTMAESGFPDFVAGYWTGLVAPAGTPAAVIQTLNRAVNEALRSPEVIANLRRLGASGAPGTPEEFGALIASDVQRWAAMARKVKISAN